MSTQRKPKAVCEEFVVASWNGIPRALFVGRDSTSERGEHLHRTFFLLFGTKGSDSSSKPRTSSAAPNERKYSPFRRWVGMLAADRRLPRSAPGLQTQGDKKPCERSCSERSQSTRGLPDSLTPGLLAHTSLLRTLLKNAGSRGGRWMAFLESEGVWETERRQQEASDLVYSVLLRVSEPG